MPKTLDGLSARIGEGPVPVGYTRLVVRNSHYSSYVDQKVKPCNYIDFPDGMVRDALKPRAEYGGGSPYGMPVDDFPRGPAIVPTTRVELIKEIIRPLPPQPKSNLPTALQPEAVADKRTKNAK